MLPYMYAYLFVSRPAHPQSVGAGTDETGKCVARNQVCPGEKAEFGHSANDGTILQRAARNGAYGIVWSPSTKRLVGSTTDRYICAYRHNICAYRRSICAYRYNICTYMYITYVYMYRETCGRAACRDFGPELPQRCTGNEEDVFCMHSRRVRNMHVTSISFIVVCTTSVYVCVDVCLRIYM